MVKAVAAKREVFHRFLSMMKKIILIILAIVTALAEADLVQAERLSVKANIANIRSGPDTSGTVIWQVERYHPLNVVQKQGDWYLFEDFEGDRGWIHKTLLDDVKSVIVKNDTCNVRSGPGTQNEIRFTVDKGVPFKVLEEKKDWLHVVHADGDQGWIHRSLVW
jgi:SH3-like domain-containing protein